MKLHVRDAGPADAASKYYGIAWKVAKLNLEQVSGQSLIVMGHLRRASQGLIGQKVSHPFTLETNGVTWAFQHSGSLLKDPAEPDRLNSQVVFKTILSSLGGAHQDVAAATSKARQAAIEEYGGFTSLSFMLSDGQYLHVFREFQTNGQYYTLYVDNFGEMIIAASEPILAMRAEPIPRRVLCSVTRSLDFSALPSREDVEALHETVKLQACSRRPECDGRPLATSRVRTASTGSPLRSVAMTTLKLAS